MTRISVNDVGMFPTGFSSAGSTKVTDNSFQSILNEQTDVTRMSDEENVQDTVADTPEQDAKAESQDYKKYDNKTEKEQPTESVEPRKDVVKDESVNNEGSEEGKDASEEEMQSAVSEILATLQQQIMDTLQMSEEEFAALLDDMGLEAVDLLQGDNLSAFVLEATGAGDSLALLTNEELLQDYRQIMQTLDSLLEQASEQLDMPVAQLQEQLLLREEVMTEDMPLEQGIQKQPEGLQEGQQPIVEVTVTEGAAVKDHSAAGEQSQQHRDGEAGKEQQVQSPFAFQFQNTSGNAAEIVNQVISETTGAWVPDTRNIMNQIMDYMKVQISPEVTNLEMQLHPASLGTIQVQLESTGDAVNAHFIAQNDAVKAVLETQLVELKQQFQEQGVKVNDIEVSVSTQTFEQNFEQGRQAGQTEEGNRPRIRRINLNELTETEAAEAMEAADRIAVEMMTANGNTVDYMA